MRRVRGKLTYSNVMVTILAILVLGGGGAYAASVGVKPNSVGAAQLKPNSVGESELQAESVGAQQMQANAITSEAISGESISTPKIKNGSVTLSKLSAALKSQIEAQKGEAGATGAQGAQGAQGIPGIQGPPGTSAPATPLAVEHVSASSANENSKEKEVTVTCTSGTVLSGGYVLNSNNNLNVTLRAVRSYAVTNGSWLVRALNGGTAENWELTVVAVCLAP
jgi:hypothetical protein